MTKNKPTCVLVAGMHRSGTSALARVLSILGCELPKTLMVATPSNETGHWESQEIANLNDELIASAGSTWDDFMPFTQGWFKSPRADQFRLKCSATFKSEFADAKLTMLKDPRICRLVPFWLDVIEETGVNPLVILPIRNPLDVAESLAKRDMSDTYYNQYLWLRHVLDAEKGSRGTRRFFCSYDDLLNSWSSVISRSEEVLNFKWPSYSADACEEIDAYVSSHYRHHAFMPSVLLEDTRISDWLRNTYKIMLRWAASGENPDDYEMLDAISQAFDFACMSFARIVYRGRRAHTELGNLKQQTFQQKDIIHNLSLRIADLETALANAEKKSAQQNDEIALLKQRGAELQR